MNSKNLLKYVLQLGGVYFFLVAIAHLSGWKIPGLFVYYNVPSYNYQDKIISFLAFGWSMFFWQSSFDVVKNKSAIKTIIIIGIIALLGLSYINLSITNEISSQIIDTSVFWIETGILTIYLVSIVWTYLILLRRI